MARADIPGVRITVGTPRSSGEGSCCIAVTMEIVNLWELLWHTLAEYYHLRWHEWPGMLLRAGVVLVRYKLGTLRLLDETKTLEIRNGCG